jgi:hypothetical protein
MDYLRVCALVDGNITSFNMIERRARRQLRPYQVLVRQGNVIDTRFCTCLDAAVRAAGNQRALETHRIALTKESVLAMEQQLKSGALRELDWSLRPKRKCRLCGDALFDYDIMKGKWEGEWLIAQFDEEYNDACLIEASLINRDLRNEDGEICVDLLTAWDAAYCYDPHIIVTPDSEWHELKLHTKAYDEEKHELFEKYDDHWVVPFRFIDKFDALCHLLAAG